LLVLVVPDSAGGCARSSFDAAAESQKLLQRDVEWANTEQ
jgi:hypothetical protein